MLSGPSSGLLGENLAIISRDYLNLSLRLGYHFSAVDAHLGGDVNRDYVYFRFTGGLAGPERRGRRVKSISQVPAMDFKVMVKGDSAVIGSNWRRHHSANRPVYPRSLDHLSRQRDTCLQRCGNRALFSFFPIRSSADITRRLPRPMTAIGIRRSMRRIRIVDCWTRHGFVPVSLLKCEPMIES